MCFNELTPVSLGGELQVNRGGGRARDVGFWEDVGQISEKWGVTAKSCSSIRLQMLDGNPTLTKAPHSALFLFQGFAHDARHLRALLLPHLFSSSSIQSRLLEFKCQHTPHPCAVCSSFLTVGDH